MPDIVINTYALEQYAGRLADVNRRLVSLDWRIKALYDDVGLLGLKNLIQIDLKIGYSARLLGCQRYLNSTAASFMKVENKLESCDPTTFDKPPVSGAQEWFYDVGNAVKKAASIVMKPSQVIESVFVSYYSQGWAYQAVQYGKAILKAAKGITKIASGVGSLLGTGGLSAPVAVLTIISGMNDVTNATVDALYVHDKNYDQVGKVNVLKDTLKESGKEIGRAIGNEKIGEWIGSATYYGIDIVTSLAALDESAKKLGNSFDKIKQLKGTDYRALGGELKEIGSTKIDISKLLHTDMETLRYETKLAGYAYQETSNFVKNASALYQVGKNTIKVTKNTEKVLSPFLPEDYKNPVLETYDKVSDIKDKAGKYIKVSSKIAKFVFD